MHVYIVTVKEICKEKDALIFNKYDDWENFDMTTTIVSNHYSTNFPVDLEYE